MCPYKQICKVCTDSGIEMVPVDDHVVVQTAFIQTNAVEETHPKCSKLERHQNCHLEKDQFLLKPHFLFPHGNLL